MSNFFDNEAEVSDGDDEEYTEREKTKLKKLKQIDSDDSSEEDDDDEDELREVTKGFINDDDDDEESGSGSGSDSDEERGGKRRRNDDDDDDLDADNLDEDDLDLIEENIGVKLDRKKKFKRLKRIEDEDSDDGEDDKEQSIQQGSGDEMEVSHHEGDQEQDDGSNREEDSDVEDFIVDDDGKPLAKPKKRAIFEDEGLETARNIFGVEFDYNEISQYDDWGEGDEELDEDEDAEDIDYDDEDEDRPRKKKKERRKPVTKSIYDVFEPSELERGHLTDQDHEIRKNDIPERFQLRLTPVTSTRRDGDDRAKDTELEREANWIYTHAFYKPCISNQDGRDEARMRPRSDLKRIQKIHNALDLIRNATCEVPFIAFYRKEEVQPELNINDLWKVYQFDEKWCQLKMRKDGLMTLVQNMMDFQGDQIMKDVHAPIPEDMRTLSDHDVFKVEEVDTFEQFNDMYKHYLLYYGKDQPEMKAYVKKKQRENMKTTRTVTRTVKVKRMIKRKKLKKKANIGDEESDDDNKSTKSDYDEDSSHKKKKKIISDSEDESDDGGKRSNKIMSDDEGFEDRGDRSDDDDEDEDKNKDKENDKSDTESKKSKDDSDNEEKNKSDDEEKNKSDDEEKNKSDDEEKNKSDDEEKNKSDDAEKNKSDDEEKNKSDDEEKNKSDKDDEKDKSDNEDKSKSDDEDTVEKNAAKTNEDDTEKMDVDGDNTSESGKKDKESEKENENMDVDQDNVTEGKDKEPEEDDEEEVEVEVETEVEEEIEEEPEENEGGDALKKAVRRHEYELLRRCNTAGFAKKFGLTPEQFGENVRDNYQRYEVEQFQEDPLTEAKNFLSKICTTPERVLEASVRMVGWQIACEPLVRKTLREGYFERARITVTPTPLGLKLIDEQHHMYTLKFIKDKPVTDLIEDQFFRIKSANDDKLITFTLSDNIEGNSSHNNALEEMKQLYYRDEFSQVVQDWNDLRGRAVEFAYKRIIIDLKRELIERLYQESKDHIVELCCRKLYDWLKIAPYNPGNFQDEDTDWHTDDGFRVFSIAFVPDDDIAAFGCCIDAEGDCIEYIRMPNLMFRKNSYNERQAGLKEDELGKIKSFIINRKPHVVAIGGESREAIMVMEDLQEILKELEEQESFPKIKVELVDNELARMYAVSKKGEQDFLDYPPLLRQAISLGRRVQDPLVEFSQMCNPDEELLNLRFHSMQELINQQDLLKALYIEFVNRTNEVGVDLNRAVAYPYTHNLVQFICGLGPRKANALIKQMKQTNQRLENRNQLVVNFHMGPKVFINCAGFIKIDTNSLNDSDNYIEVLDSTRIHPEAYDWARKMAVDALEYEDGEGKPAEALEEILEMPEKLSELDLEAFATELHNQGFGQKMNTLYDIRHELNHRYKDFRVPFRTANPEEVFNMLTKESPETFYVGKIVQPFITTFIHREPRGDQLDNANPVRNEETGLWQCPFCLKNDFPELSEVWNHFDAGDCRGQAIGIKVRLDNGISGFINIKNLSDKTVTNPADRVKIKSLIYCRIMKIDPEKFSVELTSKTSDLQDHNNKWKAIKDSYYDYEAEEKMMESTKKKSEKKKSQYQKRVIAHPSFKNIDYNEAEKIMETLEQGDVIIRPSSKGVDHLTATWKVTDNICQHIDIKEQEKLNDFSLGRKLWIGREEFEDLDEIIARYISPTASNVRQILEYKYYKESFMGDKEKSAKWLKEEKQRNPKNIPYIFSPLKHLPGKFLLSYLPRVKVFHEYVTVSSETFRFRSSLNFQSLPLLLKWFKANFRKLASGIGASTPGGMMSSRTPYMGGTTPNMGRMDQSVQKSTNMASMYSMSGGASVTPYGANTPGGYSNYSNYAQTPYTPSGQTPFMTPYNTPGPSTTPRYGAQTPSQSNNYNTGGRTPQHRPLPPPSRGNMNHLPPPPARGNPIIPPPSNRMNPNFPPPTRGMPNPPPNRGNPNPAHNENYDWGKAAESWAKSRNAGGRNTPRTDGRSTPRHSETGSRYAGSNYGDERHTPRYDERSVHGGSEGRHTPRYDDRRASYYDYDNPSRNTPRSARSTPKTIHSPTNMSIGGGDQTPLYDE